MKITIKLIFLSFLLTCQNACKKKGCDFAGPYNFIISASLTPAKDTFNIGDTILVSSIFSNNVYDETTDQTYKLEDFNFYPGTEIIKIDTINNVPKISGYFDIKIDTLYNYNLINFNDGGDGLSGQYNYQSNSYSLEYRLIPLKSGLFYLEQGISLDLGSQDFEGKCSNQGIDGSVNMNNHEDNNIDFLNDSPNEHYNLWILQKPEKRFYKFGGYCFYVEE